MKKKSMIELNRVDVDKYHDMEKIPLIVVLDDVRSLNNIGSVFRTADAFLIEKIYLCGITAVPPNPDIHKTALGAEFSVDWEYRKNIVELIEELKDSGCEVCAIEQVNGSVDITEFNVDKNKRYAVIFGNEVKGVCQEAVDASDVCIEIPQFGTKHSLNISITAGIVMWNFLLSLKIC